jgi:hypothetical protein
MVNLSCKFEEEIMGKIEMLSQKNKRSNNQIVRILVDYCLNEPKIIKELKL